MADEQLFGIVLSVHVWRNDEEPLDSDEFWDKFLDFIEGNGWVTGGTSTEVDLNADPDAAVEANQRVPAYQARHRKDSTHEE